jgi:signal transduction histidine kinase
MGKLNQISTDTQTVNLDPNEEVLSTYRLKLTERIVRNIAHEVRNPLTNIMLGLDQLKNEMGELDEAQEVYFSIIQRNCERINQLITNLVNSAKQSDLILEDSSVNVLMDEVITLSETKLKEKNIQVIKKFASDIPKIKLDSAKIRDAFENLLLNAIQAIQNDNGILEIETSRTKNECIIKIKDNGVGIEAENLQKIFDPFFRARTNGSGLGLTTTQNIIHTHKGKINVDSEPGKGSVFTVALSC